MGITEDLADALARDTMAAVDELGDDGLVAQMSKILASSSIAAQEAFMAAVRVMQAERRARKHLDETLARGRAKPPA
jgi:hypothetical protein